MNPLDGKAAIGISIPQLCIKQGFRLSDNMTAFYIELVAILWALGWLEGQTPGRNVLCSDSTAALMAIKSRKSEARPDLIIEVLIALNWVIKEGNTVGFMWVPAQ